MTSGRLRARVRPRLLGALVPVVAVMAVGTVGIVGTASTAYAADVSIDHVEPDDQSLQVVLSLGDLGTGSAADLDTVTVTFDGTEVPATAQPIAEATDVVERTAILTMDVSRSMKGAKFAESKDAARVFLDTVPHDVNVGLVTFADTVRVVQAPTRHHAAIRAAIRSLHLSRRTRLNDGLLTSLRASGDTGARSILLLSDGRDTSGTPLDRVVTRVSESGAKVDVVALAQGARDTAVLQQLADAGDGQVLRADDPTALSAVFADEAQALAQQVLVTVQTPPELSAQEGTLAVSLAVDGRSTTDSAFVALPTSESTAPSGALPAQLVPVQDEGLVVSPELMYAGLGAAGLGVMVLLVMAIGGLSRSEQQDAVDRSIEAYTRKGARKLAEAHREDGSASMTKQAVAVAQSVLEGQKDFEASLGLKLEAAGLALKPAEWLLIHAGVAVGTGMGGLLLGGGSLLFMLLGLVVGAAAPWLFLGFKRKRRLAAFNGQLADTLQLMAGSLSAGLSLAQSVDTVVREGNDPMAGEFRRALVETRLGVEIEDAMLGIADRMQSVDFEWVVMAIRIQREVGGNLSELLNKVAETIREREYLERQVLTLSAEGRLSVWILGGLPPAFMGYLMLVNPSYVTPMFTSPLGWVMVTIMSILLTGGIFWMKKVVKVEV